ncbi:MAG: ABC transporter ATP-binding protein [Rhabdochlamydiaceae bacterium]
MKLLLRSVLRTKKHLSLLVCTFFTLLLLTIASQMEMFSLGVLSNNSVDFFEMFNSGSSQIVELKDVKESWPLIDKEGKGYISKEQAVFYLRDKQKSFNPLNSAIIALQCRFGVVHNIKAMVLVLLGVAIFRAVGLFASRYTTQLLAIRVSRDLRQQYFEHIQSLPMSFYQKHNIGSLSSRVVGDATQIASSINSCVVNYLQSPFTVLSCLIFCCFLSWQLSLLVFLGMPMIVVPIILLARRVKGVSRQLQLNQEKFASVLIDFLAGIQTVKIFGMELFSLKKYKEQNDRMALLEGKTAKYALMSRPVLHAITTFCVASVVIFGLYTLKMPLSELIVFCGMLQLAYEPVKKFADENANIQKGVVAAERMFEVLNLKSLILDVPEAKDITSFKESIEFDHVWFGYNEKDWILKDVSFAVRKGEKVAILGETGAGKSTIVQLIPRLYDVQKGEIRIDGKPLKSYTQKSLRSLMAFVSQKPFLFLDTISANISVGNNYSQSEIEKASHKAHAAEFVENMEGKYESVLLEGGQNLSGGQQQRLAIARALVRNCPILILDEATSALDNLSEIKIKEAIASLESDVTQIIIAHRLTTIEHVDRIIYLEKGRKVAEGTKEELLVSCPGFKKSWEALYKGKAK